MKDGKALWQKMFFLISGVVLSVLFGITTAFSIAERQYETAAGLVSALSEGADLPQALKQAYLQRSSNEAGQAILHKYGYRRGNLEQRDISGIVGRSALIFAVFMALTMGLHYVEQKRRLKRLEELTRYLEAVNCGQEPLLTRHEDSFSHLEDEIYKTVTELRLSRNAACQERERMADNLADISHQLKTPLTSMSLMAQLLAEQAQENQEPYLERLSRQISRLERLVSSLLALSRLDAGTIRMESQKTEVYSLLVQAAEPIEELARERGVHLNIQSQPDEEIWVDISWTAEALLNLIKNCVEHTPADGEVTVSYDQNPLYMQIVIQDTGPGFDPKEIPYLFQRFYRGKGAAKDSIGIGLALSRSILEKQGGVIRADNLPDVGAKFTVKLYHKIPFNAVQQ